jgi:hypothetical protein
MEYAKVDGRQNLVRNLDTNALVNINSAEYNQYITLKRMKQNEENKISSLENEIIGLKNDLSEIKSLLKSIVNETI